MLNHPANSPKSKLLSRFGKSTRHLVAKRCECMVPLHPRVHAIANGRFELREQCTECGWVAKNPVPRMRPLADHEPLDIAAFEKMAAARLATTHAKDFKP